MNLMDMLPPIHENNAKIQEIQTILTKKISDLASDDRTTLDQCFINTATSMLSRYETIHGLKVDVTKLDEFRRERIRAKMRGVGTVTKQMIIDTAASYSNGEVEVIENNANNNFKIKFIGTMGIPANMADLILTIEEIKPAHLSFIFEYVYNTWDDVSTITWNEASAYTWEGLKVKK